MDYKSSGVNIDAGNDAVERIKPLVKKTFNAQVLSHLGHFAGMMEIPAGYTHPVLVSCTDGVGTKLMLAIATGKLDTIGIDLVAMSVNDLICCGAKPLFFLDYYACHALVPEDVEQVLKGITDACLESDCALVGGEMAEMNDMYKKDDFDLAGFCVGVVEKSDIITGENIRKGMGVYGLASSGAHSNGYSLIRKVFPENRYEDYGLSLEDLLRPTKLYVKPVLQCIADQELAGIAHITGGGLLENIERIVPKGLGIEIDWNAWEVPKLFQAIQQVGAITDTEMRRVFNMGIGMVLICEKAPNLEGIIQIGTVK